MGFPIAALLAGVGSAASFGIGLYDLYVTKHYFDLEQRQLDDRMRYYNDYEKNRGVEALYPYYSGVYADYVGSALSAGQSVLRLYEKYDGQRSRINYARSRGTRQGYYSGYRQGLSEGWRRYRHR